MVTVEEGMEVSRILNVQIADYELRMKVRHCLGGLAEYMDNVSREDLYSEEVLEEIDTTTVKSLPVEVREALVQIRAYCDIHKCGMWRLISM